MSNHDVCVGPCRDEVAQLRAQLQQAEACWRETFDESAIGMVHMALDCGWIRVNQHFCAMLGYTVDELLAKTIAEITYPEDWVGNAAAMQQLAAGERQRYITNKRYFHRDGHVVWGKLTLRLARTAEGAPDYFVAVTEDITDLKQAEDALRVSEARHRHIVEALADPVCRFGADYHFTFVNEPYAAIFGKPPAELIGQHLLNLVPAQYHARTLAHLSSISREHPLTVDENEVELVDGSVRWFQWNNRLIELSDGTFEYQGVGHDLTEQKATENRERNQRQLADVMRDSLATLTSSLDVEAVMTQILALVARVVPNDASRIILLEEGDGRTIYTQGYSPEAVAWLKEHTVAPIRSAGNNILDGKHPYLITDVHAVSTVTLSTPLAWIRSTMGVPIAANDEIFGLLVVNSATPNFYHRSDLEKLQAFAIYANLALRNAYEATRLEQRVTERTAELQAAKEQVEAILHHSSEAILLVANDLHIVQSNAVFDKLFCNDETARQRQSLLNFIHPADHVKVQDGSALALDTGHDHHLELRACCGEDGYFDAELSISPMDDAGFVCTLRDISERKARERQLLYAASLQENVTDAVITVDMAYKIQSWNKAAETIFGWRAAEVTGQTTLAILHTLYLGTESTETASRILFNQGYWEGEVIQQHKDGTPRNIFASITLLRDAQQEPFGMVAISRDITKQRQIEMALKESRYFAKQIVDTAPSIIYVYDFLEYRHLYINNNITNKLGYSVEEFSTLGQRMQSEVTHPDDLNRYLEHRKQVLASNDGQIFAIESRMRHKNGTWRWFLVQNTIFQRSADGTPTQILGVATDITESKQASEHLRHQRDFLQQIVDQVPAIIMVKDRSGHFQLSNKHADYIYGKTAAVTFFQPTDEEAFTTGQPIFVPEQAILGTYYQINKIPLTNEAGELDRLLVVAVDISDHKQAAVALAQALQTEKELNEHKSHFISTISHEFRTPITVIQSMTESLRAYRHKLTDAQIAQRLDKIFDRTQYMTEMMKDVTEFARIQARRVRFQPTPCDSIALCLDLVSGFQNVSRPLLFTHEGNLSLINLDERLLNQILSNLIENAIKYSMADKHVLLHLAYRGDTLALTVTDEGIGIPAADIKFVYQPFYRASNVENIPGTGLGLSIAKEAAELHGGTITVESVLGKGSTFTVQIPV